MRLACHWRCWGSCCQQWLPFCPALLVVRTAWEDRLLQAELDGYADYARRVRYKLVPGIW